MTRKRRINTDFQGKAPDSTFFQHPSASGYFPDVQMIARIKEMGMLVIVATDGDVTKLVPWMQSVGIDGVLPLERQAEVNGTSLREAFPDLLMVGHYDKMVMNRGEEAMRAEFERLVPLMQSGGYIPSVDHQTPPGVSLDEYRVYLSLLDEYTGRAKA